MPIRTRSATLAIVAAFLVCTGALPALSALAQSPATASADVRDRLSRFIGTVTLQEEQGGVRLTGVLRYLPPGAHGLHIDNVAKCLSPTFLTAGTIFNPTGKKHGLRNPAGPQVGDLPSLVVPADGTASVNVVAAGASLSGGPSSLIGGNGTALVLHVQDDDQVTDPEGNAGDRIACGVILPSDPVAASATAQSRSLSSMAGAVVPGPVGQAPGEAAQPAAALAPPGPAAVVQPPSTANSGASGFTTLFSLPVFALVVGVVLLTAGYLLRHQTRHRQPTPSGRVRVR